MLELLSEPESASILAGSQAVSRESDYDLLKSKSKVLCAVAGFKLLFQSCVLRRLFEY